MRKIVFFLFLSFNLCFNVLSSEEPVIGKKWKELSQDSKLVYMNGFYEALSWVGGVLPDGEGLDIAGYFPVDLSFPDIVKKLDEFYQDDKFLLVPVALVLNVINLEVNDPDSKWLKKSKDMLLEGFSFER